ncbi:hypothetical protein [Nesterenkonia sp. HG001]|uniref:hypothetical protein n=1 Tax=Nesterenkonia sp. HG001 TaxID=2983207 RepID=UPI002AC79701|nr:hypothetical protein [Nesterenkonia sp. HG001]MDZ5077325.1 hypothetical protein [Nesterenkonia sp. HG001]
MTSAPRGAPGGPAGPERLGLLVLAVILVGLTLRSPIVGVPPVLGAISAELAFSPTTVAVLAGWRWAISLPGLFVVLALVVWVLRMRVAGVAGARGMTAGWQASGASGAAGSSGASPAPGPGARAEAGGDVWRESGAWWLAVFFGMQSLLFYTGATWMPAQLVESGGLSEATAGTALSIFHLIGIAGTLLVPSMLRISGDARIVGAGIGAGWFLFFAGLQTAPELWPLLMATGGLVQGAGIGLSLTLIAMRPVDLAFGRQLSGMVQGVGYAIAATGPVMVGMIHEVTRSWWWGTGMLLLCSSVMVAAAWQAGRSSPLGPEPCPDV